MARIENIARHRRLYASTIAAAAAALFVYICKYSFCLVYSIFYGVGRKCLTLILQCSLALFARFSRVCADLNVQ